MSWIQTTSSRSSHKIVNVQAASIHPIEAPDAYTHVPRRILGKDGVVRNLLGD